MLRTAIAMGATAPGRLYSETRCSAPAPGVRAPTARNVCSVCFGKRNPKRRIPWNRIARDELLLLAPKR
eukprot:4570763-Lingulodinium_polyedra.AAC.1